MTASAAAEVTRSWERYLRDSAISREVIDDFIQRPHWAMFDPELGYILHNSLVQWGVGDSRTIETFLPGGARSRFLYAGRKPRINTYGNSFTECTQVSDGETWQEYLARPRDLPRRGTCPPSTCRLTSLTPAPSA
jgi:hypothetical protein